MAIDTDFKFEKFEEYFGDIKQIQKQINNCTVCGSKLVITHLSDYKNLLMQESARCPDCGVNNKKTIHIIN
jgi:DNA-directed RNA polymerase subunit RPC12/RpoP